MVPGDGGTAAGTSVNVASMGAAFAGLLSGDVHRHFDARHILTGLRC
jgi:hypothetical protein